MTVTNQTKKVTANANGSATVFSFSPIVIFDTPDIEVVHVDALGVETVLTEGTGAFPNYAVVPATGSFPSANGVTGSIRVPEDEIVPLVSGISVVMKRLLTLEQQVDLENQGGYFPDVQETALDKNIMIDLQQQEEVDRSLKILTSESATVNADLPAAVADAFLKWNATGTAIIHSVLSTATADASDLNPADVDVDGGVASGTSINFSRQDHVHEFKNWFIEGVSTSSATTLIIPAIGNFFHVTGTTQIDAIEDTENGRIILLEFDDVLQITQHPTNLIIPNGKNITTEAGDFGIFMQYATGDWRCLSFIQKGSGHLSEIITAGQMIIGNSSGRPAQLGVGATDEVLTVVAGLPSWETNAAVNLKNAMTMNRSTADDEQTFTGDGTWTKPGSTTANSVTLIVCTGGGGGGGSGGESGSGDDAGGGGGAGGNTAVGLVLTDNLAGTQNVTVGVGGAGGLPPSANSPGLPGTVGGSSHVDNIIIGTGGEQGGGGAGQGSAGINFDNANHVHNITIRAEKGQLLSREFGGSGSAGLNGVPLDAYKGAFAGGGAGGGGNISQPNDGGEGGGLLSTSIATNTGGGGTAGSASDGGNGATNATNLTATGGGGASSGNFKGGDGGDGGGGGGGGGSVNGTNSNTDGGDGGPGRVTLYTWL